MLKVLLGLLMTMSLPPLALAKGTVGGGGGYVALINNKYKLLDLVEFGSDTNPYNPAVNIHPKILKKVQASLHAFSKDVQEDVARKISDIHAQDTYLAYFLLEAMKEYAWKVVSVPIKRLDDIGESNVDLRTVKIYQAAVRTFVDITLSREVVARMDTVHISALVFHEIIYAMLYPVVTGSPPNYVAKDQVNFDARRIVGSIYSEAVKHEGYRATITKNNHPNKSRFTYVDFTSKYGWITKKGKPVMLFSVTLDRTAGSISLSSTYLNDKPQDIPHFCSQILADEKFEDMNSGRRTILTQVTLDIYKQKRIYGNTWIYRGMGMIDSNVYYERGSVQPVHSPIFRPMPEPTHGYVTNVNECIQYMNELEPLKDPVETLY